MTTHVGAVPDVLVQHPTKRVNYLIPGARLPAFAVGPTTWSDFGPDTVTFVIPDPSALVDDMPPFNRTVDGEIAIHIQDPARQAAYFLSATTLEEFLLDCRPQDVDYDFSFIVPVGLELVEELPALMRGLLQSQESPRQRATTDGAGAASDALSR